MSDIKLPRMPNVQVPRIDADVSLIDIRVLANWCQRFASEYARAAVEADRADRAQQDAPTDAEKDAILHWIIRAAQEAKEPCSQDDQESPTAIRNGRFAGIAQAAAQALGMVRGPSFAPAQDAERERDKERLDWFDANCKRESSMRFGEEFKPVFAWAIACDPQPGVTVRDAIDGIMGAARAQRADKEPS